MKPTWCTPPYSLKAFQHEEHDTEREAPWFWRSQHDKQNKQINKQTNNLLHSFIFSWQITPKRSNKLNHLHAFVEQVPNWEIFQINK